MRMTAENIAEKRCYTVKEGHTYSNSRGVGE